MADPAATCLVCASSPQGALTTERAMRLQGMLGLQEDKGPDVHLCLTCDDKLRNIEQLVAEMKMMYDDRKKDGKPDQSHQQASSVKQELDASKKLQSPLSDDANTVTAVAVPQADQQDAPVSDAVPGLALTDRQRKLACGCGAIFESQAELVAHRKANHGGGLVCRDCGLTLTRTADVKAHATAHTANAFRCIVCGVGFGQMSALKLHQRLSKTCCVHFETEEDLQCGCGDSFSTTEELKSHRDKEHGGRLVCDTCDKSYVSRAHLQRHQQQMHGRHEARRPTARQRALRQRNSKQQVSSEDESSDRSCEDNGPELSKTRVTRTSGRVVGNRSVGAGRRSRRPTKRAAGRPGTVWSGKDEMTLYLCPVCDLVAPSRSAQQRHIDRYHWQTTSTNAVSTDGACQEQFVCHKCSLTSTDCHQMAVHAVEHCAQGLVQCPQCPFIFPDEGFHHARHKMLMHRAERIRPVLVYRCATCSEQLETPSQLARHLLAKHPSVAMATRVPTAEMQACGYCSERLTSTKALFQHIKAAHPVSDDADVDHDNIVGEDVAEGGDSTVDDGMDTDEEEEEEQDLDDTKDGPSLKEEAGGERASVRSDGSGGGASGGCQYLCPVCDVTYQNSHLQLRHLQRYHWRFPGADRTDMACTACEYKTTALAGMIEHCRNAHPDALYACQHCPAVLPQEKVFRRKHMLQEHRYPASDSPPQVHACTSCSFEAATPSELARHLLEVHGNTSMSQKAAHRVHACKYCELSFRYQTALIKHIASTHERQPEEGSGGAKGSIKQENLGVGVTPGSVAEAEESAGSKGRQGGRRAPHVCPTCHKEYKLESSYLAHVRYYCGKASGEKRSAKRDKSYLCSLCGTVLTSYSGFQTHMANHYDRHRFKCDLCPKAFAKRGQLNFHRRTHARPFICQSCGKRFKTLSHLKDHQITHSDEQNFCCTMCSARFKWRPTLVRHLYKMHGQGPKPDSSSRRKMLCILCNMRVSSGKRTKHFQRRHKDLPYDLKFFRLLTNDPQQEGSMANNEEPPAGPAFETVVSLSATMPALQETIPPTLMSAPPVSMTATSLPQYQLKADALEHTQTVEAIATPQMRPSLQLAVDMNSLYHAEQATHHLVSQPEPPRHELVQQPMVTTPHHQMAETADALRAEPSPSADSTRHASTPSYLEGPTTTAYTNSLPQVPSTVTAVQREENVTFDVVSIQTAMESQPQQGHYQVIQDPNGVPVVIQPQWQ